jgi:hypothetical protein
LTSAPPQSVVSVNGQTGVVVITAESIGAATGTPVYVEHDTNALEHVAGLGVSLTNTQGDVSSMIGDITKSYVVVNGTTVLPFAYFQDDRPCYRVGEDGDLAVYFDGYWRIDDFITDYSPVHFSSKSYLPPRTGFLSGVSWTSDASTVMWFPEQINNTNAVQMNSTVTVSNDTAWTGWTTTGVLTNGAMFLLPGQYVQSPILSSGVSSYSYRQTSHQNGTMASPVFMDGTNELSVPFAGTNAVLTLTAGNAAPGSTPGVYVSNVVFVGYSSPAEAAIIKKVTRLKIIDEPAETNDVVSKSYSDANTAGAQNYADLAISSYAADSTKTLHGAQMRLNQSWQAMTDNGQDWILSCGEISGSGQLVGTSNYFALAQNDYPLLTFSADASGLYIRSYSRTTVDATNQSITLNIATNGVTDQPYAEWTTNLMVGAWTHVLTYTSNSYPTAVCSNYVLKFTAPTGALGYFRAMQPAGLSRITVKANVLDLGSNAINSVSSVVFTNGWKIICTSTGLQFAAP